MDALDFAAVFFDDCPRLAGSWQGNSPVFFVAFIVTGERLARGIQWLVQSMCLEFRDNVRILSGSFDAIAFTQLNELLTLSSLRI